MVAQTVAGIPAGPPRGERRPFLTGGLSRRTVVTAAAVGWVVMLLSLAALLYFTQRAAELERARANATTAQGAPWPTPLPIIRSSELWYATTPAPGVWAELKVVLDNPLQAGPTKTTLLVSGSLLEDFKIRSTEPKLLTQPRRRPDGRYALVFPAPIPESLNWLRVFLECRKAAPRPLSLGFMLDGARALPDQSPTTAQVFFSDRQADPFIVVPERLVSWVPGQAQSAFPVLVVYAVAMGTIAAAGCVAAFWAVRR
jgi:hypothetical protein